MRGTDTFTESPFTLHRLDDFVPANHPLRPIRQMVNEALGKMDALFAAMYEAPSKGGRPSIAPEKLLRALLLQVFYSIRFENASSWSRCSTTCCTDGYHRPGDGGCGVAAHRCVHEKPRALGWRTMR